MVNNYTVSELLSNVKALIITKIFYPNARFIRRPVFLRGKKSLKAGSGLTTGYNCRFDLPGTKRTLWIGENCEFGDMVHIVAYEHVEIGDDCLLASKVFISDTEHGNYSGVSVQSNPATKPRERILSTKPVKIGDRVWIGDNVCILSGVIIGNGCIIGANSVVTSDIEPNSISAGVPARIIKKWDEVSEVWVRV